MSTDAVSWVLVLLVLAPAVAVVRSRNLVHGVLWLGLVLLSTAALYVRLGAPFVATVQVLLYAGGVLVLLVLGVMLTRRHDGVLIETAAASPLRGLTVAGALFAAGSLAIVRGVAQLPPPRAPAAPQSLGQALLTEHLLAFEVLSVLLLGALVGTIVIARNRDHLAVPAKTHPQEDPASAVAVALPQREEPAAAAARKIREVA